jgi:tetratricopeptide (TPR) repeat protein
MEKSPSARYATARALAEDLRRYAQDLPIVAKRPGPLRRTAKFMKRHKAPVIAISAAVLLLATNTFLAHARRSAKEHSLRALTESATNFVMTNRWEDAERELDRALQIEPRDVQALLTFAWLKLEHFQKVRSPTANQDLIEADDYCRRILRIDPENVKALGYRGVALRRLGRHAEAIKTLEKSLVIQPDDYASCSNLGAAYAETGNLEMAARWLRQGTQIAGIEEDQWHAAVWRNLAVLELHMHDQAAVDDVANALTCFKFDVLSWVVRARIALELEGHVDLEKALDHAKFADSAAGEGSPIAKRVLALALLRNKQPERAIVHARLAIKLGDMPTINHLILAVAEAARKNPIGARDQLASAKEAWPEYLRTPGAFRAEAQRGALWIESADELIRLHDEAIMLIGEVSPG